MKFNFIPFLLVSSFSLNAFADSSISIEKLESDLKQIENLELTHEQELNYITQLNELYKAKIELSKTVESSTPKQDTKLIKDLEYKLESQSKLIEKIRLDKKNITNKKKNEIDEIYLISYFVIGEDGEAELYIGSEKFPVNTEDHVINKKTINGYQVLDINSSGVRVKKLANNKTYDLRTTSLKEIQRRADHAQQLKNELERAREMKKIDMIGASSSPIPSPKVTYQTMPSTFRSN